MRLLRPRESKRMHFSKESASMTGLLKRSSEHRHKDWQEINAHIEQDEARLDEHHDLRAQGHKRDIPETPWIDSVEKAAKKLDVETSQQRYVIKAYAQRNYLRHSGAKRLIEQCDWKAHAEQLNRDISRLYWLYGNDEKGYRDMRAILKRIKNQFFDHLHIERGRLKWKVNKEADRRGKLRIAKRERREAERLAEEKRIEADAERRSRFLFVPIPESSHEFVIPFV
ncbi:MAG: hypothetical protein L6R40_005269 [Gallowayella cf. fulva]|nr:MAG: hypothetical protein L6R40_005269 [Xanthomendoza cf. fulva]